MAGWKSIKWACGLMQFSKIKDCCVLIQSANIHVLPDENPFFFQQWIHFRLDLNPSFYSQWIQYKYFNSVLAYFQLAYSKFKNFDKKFFCTLEYLHIVCLHICKLWHLHILNLDTSRYLPNTFQIPSRHLQDMRDPLQRPPLHLH